MDTVATELKHVAQLADLIDRIQRDRPFRTRFRDDPVRAAAQVGLTPCDSEWAGLRDLLYARPRYRCQHPQPRADWPGAFDFPAGVTLPGTSIAALLGRGADTPAPCGVSAGR